MFCRGIFMKSAGASAALVVLLGGQAIAQSPTTSAKLIVPRFSDPTFKLTVDGPFDEAFPHYMMIQELNSAGKPISACILKRGASDSQFSPGASKGDKTYLVHAFGGTQHQLFTIYGGISGSGYVRTVDLKDKDFKNQHAENGHLTITVKFPIVPGSSGPSEDAVKKLTPKFKAGSASIPAGIPPC